MLFLSLFVPASALADLALASSDQASWSGCSCLLLSGIVGVSTIDVLVIGTVVVCAERAVSVAENCVARTEVLMLSMVTSFVTEY